MNYLKMLKIQTELKAPKNQRNNFGNYNYRSCEDILEAVKPLLADVKASLIISDDVVEIWGRIYVKATATLVDAEDWSIIAETHALAREAETKKGMDDSQITWATSSYARKYALNWLFCIDDNKDADATNTHWKELEWPFSASPKKVLKEQKKTEEKDAKSWEWYEKTLSNTSFMTQCLDEDDFIKKVKTRLAELNITMTAEQEKNLRTAYQNAVSVSELDPALFN